MAMAHCDCDTMNCGSGAVRHSLDGGKSMTINKGGSCPRFKGAAKGCGYQYPWATAYTFIIMIMIMTRFLFLLVACLACLTAILLPMLWVIVAQRRDGGRCKPTNAGFIFNRQGRYRPYDFPAVSARVSWSTARRKLSLYL